MMLALPFEIWRDVVWYEWLYMVSNQWRLIATRLNKWRSTISWWIMNWYLWNNWYCCIKLNKNGERKTFTLHRIICLSFYWSREIWYTVNHIDWDKKNNKLSNLEYCTQKENNLHAYRIWLKKPQKNMLWRLWINNPNHKMIWQYTIDWEYIRCFHWWWDVHRQTWIKNATTVCSWYSKTAWWYKRKYI